VAGDRGLGDPVRVESARGGLAGDFFRGFRDFGAAAVVHAVVDGDHVVVFRQLLGDRQFVDDTAPEAWPRTHPPDLDAHRVEGLAASSHHVTVEAHQKADFFGGTLPVLSGKGVEAEPLDPEFDCTNRRCRSPPASPILCPSTRVSPRCMAQRPFAVHHDGDMIGQPVGRNPRRRRLRGVLRRPARAAVGRGRQLREDDRPRRLVGKGRVVIGRRWAAAGSRRNGPRARLSRTHGS